MLIQQNGYGCGLYAVANACNLKNFVTPERLEQSKSGNNVGQLSRWLQDDGLQIYIDYLYYHASGRKLPPSVTGYKPFGDLSYIPILLQVQQTPNSKNHIIGGKLGKDGILYLYDSLKDDEIETTLAKVNKMYHCVYGLNVFVSYENHKYAVIE